MGRNGLLIGIQGRFQNDDGGQGPSHVGDFPGFVLGQRSAQEGLFPAQNGQIVGQDPYRLLGLSDPYLFDLGTSETLLMESPAMVTGSGREPQGINYG